MASVSTSFTGSFTRWRNADGRHFAHCRQSGEGARRSEGGASKLCGAGGTDLNGAVGSSHRPTLIVVSLRYSIDPYHEADSGRSFGANPEGLAAAARIAVHERTIDSVGVPWSTGFDHSGAKLWSVRIRFADLDANRPSECSRSLFGVCLLTYAWLIRRQLFVVNNRIVTRPYRALTATVCCATSPIRSGPIIELQVDWR